MNNKLFEMWKDDIEAFLEDTSYHAALSAEASRSASVIE
jgi:hypothetical protein